MMWIRVKEKEEYRVVEINSGSEILADVKEKKIVHRKIVEGKWATISLGEYSTKEKTIDVFAKILSHIESGRDLFRMPGEMKRE